jgi:regulator of sigma D
MQQEHYARGLAQREMQTFTRTLADALVRGDMKQYNAILKRVPEAALPLVAVPSPASLEAAMIRRALPRSLRDYMKTGKFYLYHEAVK